MSYPKYVEKGESISAQWGNDVVSSIRRRRKNPRPKVSGVSGGGDGPCVFGDIVSINDESEFIVGLLGGVCICGDKNFNVPYYGIDLETNAELLISLKLDNIKFNTDTDNTFILPGIDTSTGTPSYEETAATSNYPDNINPSTPTSMGTIYVPLGLLTVLDGNATFEAVTCGSILISHCGGILNSTRF